MSTDAQKDELFERLLREEGLASEEENPLVPRDPEQHEEPALSFAQERLWFLEQLEPNNTVYNMPGAFRLEGELDYASMERAFNHLVARHESLRTTFRQHGEEPCQRIASELRLELALEDVSTQTSSQIKLHLQQDVQQPFDLREGPLVRAKLFKTGPDEHILLVVIHHIICDGWSLGVLVRELTHCYDAFRQQRQPGLPQLSVQYADYALWQRKQLQTEKLDEQTAFWREQLSGLAPLDLASDRPRPPRPSGRGAVVHFEIGEESSQRLQALARSRETTLYHALLAAFEVLLSRYSGQEDFAVGTPVAGRLHADLEGLVGFFVNTLVMRADLSESPSFDQLLQSVKQRSLAALEHQDVPFEKLVAELDLVRDTSRHPLFQVMFVFQNNEALRFDMDGLEVEALEADTHTAKFDLTLRCTEEDQRLQCEMVFNTELFDRQTIEAMARHFTRIVEQVVEHPEQPVDQAELVDRAERETLLVEYNQTPFDYAPKGSIHQWFQEQAARTPEATAVIFEQQELSYDELDRRANQLAHRLIELGVGEDSLVPLVVERSVEMFVGLWGILKAGAAYVPLETTDPESRQAYILEDTGAKVVVTHRHLVEKLQGYTPATMVCLEADNPELQDQPCVAPEVEVGPDNLVYVIYTSGSTGRPKGVMVRHGGISHYVQWCIHTLPMQGARGSVLHSSFSFDLGVTGWLPPLVVGQPVHVLRDDHGAESLIEALDQGGEYSFIKMTPTHLRILNEVFEPEQRQGMLDGLVLGGEQLEAEDVAGWLEQCPTMRVFNHYGPTETVVGVCANELTASDQSQGPIAIGRPMGHVQAYVVDKRGNPVPEGVPGELHIGGKSVSRGYLNRAALTAEKFVPDPFGATAGGRVYRTGDRVKWRSDRRIQFLGRVDHQVKIRGYRVELGEIDSVLKEHKLVRQAAVVVWEDEQTKHLIAYVAAPKDQVTADELRLFARQTLPDYMVPTLVVVLDELPQTPNGKIDRRALPEPTFSNEPPESEAPVTSVEKALADLWTDLLPIDQVGRHQDFFAVGGHSLLATRLVSRIRASFGVEIKLREVFEYARLDELARRVELARQSDMPAIEPVERDQNLPLSFAQERLWFLSQFDAAAGAAYHMPGVVRLEGALDRGALEAALNAVVERHEALRTRFGASEGTPFQLIDDAVELDIALEDVSGLAASEQAEVMPSKIRQEVERPFDLEAGPLVRVKLWRLSDQEHVLTVVMHHIVSDGWSIPLFVREFGELYQAKIEGRSAHLVELPVQYADYAVWQREWLEGEVLDTQLAYWKENLAGLEPLELPCDHPRASKPSYRGDKVDFELSAQLTARLEALGQKSGATPYQTLLAAFEVLLSRYSGQKEIAVGSPIAGRRHADLEGLIGFFINTLVMRADLTENPSFQELLERVKKTTLDAYEHQDVPFEKLVAELEPVRDTSRHPLFQVMFVYQNNEQMAVELEGLELRGERYETHASKFDLTLELRERDEGLEGSLAYASDLFDSHSVERMVEHFVRLLEQVVEAPEARVEDLELMSDVEHQTLREWNATERDFHTDRCVHQLFEEQVERTPQAQALVFEGRSLSYAELNKLSNHLAGRLVESGVEPQEVVGICAERSLEMVVGLMGILKAGAAYLPLDPEYPAERLRFMAEDASVSVVLAQPELCESLAGLDAELVELTLDLEHWSHLSKTRPVLASSKGQAAYVLYTSGSTGKPKGVLVEHQAIVNRLLWMQDEYGLEKDDRVLQKTTYTFDVSVWEFFWPLITGATLVAAKPQGHKDNAYLADLIEAQQITTMHFVPSMLQTFVLEPGLKRRCASLRRVICSGEALAPETVRAFYQQVEHAELHNLYGPTEAAIDVTYWPCPRPFEEPKVYIGRPVANTQIHIVDEHLEPCPIGVPGELCIGGVQLARGYVNRPELTAEKFVADPLSERDDARLYRTGDKARWTGDGQVEFLGRLDFQVKLRGLRIELGEIEAVLVEHDRVQQAVVKVWQSDSGDQRLVGYVVCADQAPDDDELRDHIAQRLPDYMVPSFIVRLEEMPLSSSGKANRKALPEPDITEHQATYEAPETPTEGGLAQIWCELLGLERAGRSDNFFSLGGHSLLATRLVSRIRATLGVEIELSAVFEQPRLLELARAVDEARGSGAISKLPPIEPVERQQQMALSFAQERLWFLDQFDASAGAAYHIPGVVCLEGELRVDVLEGAFNQVVERHEALRTRFGSQEGTPYQLISESLALGVEREDLSELSGAQQAEVLEQKVQQEVERPFALDRGPLVRAKLWRLSDQEHVLAVVMHHIVSDGWSIGIFVRELAELYQAEVEQRPANVPELPVQYVDYAAWQRQWLEGEVLDTQLGYWKDKLAGLEPLELSTDHPRPPTPTYRGASVAVELGEGLTRKLKDLARQNEATLYQTLLAAFQLLLGRYTGQKDFGVGSPIAGRRHADLEGLIGFFVNTLVLRADLSQNPSFEKLLERTRQTTLEAYAHQDVPFEKLVAAIAPERDTSRTPLFQVMFALQNNEHVDVVLDGLTLCDYDQQGQVAKFDLTLDLAEQQGRLVGDLTYSTDLFDEASVAQMVRHLERLLEVIVEAPDRPVEALDYLTSEDRQKLKVWNATDAAYETEVCAHQLFEAQVDRRPEAEALVFERVSLSYAELDRRANQLAHYLGDEVGIGPGSKVGICVERSIEMVVAVLGVLKAGAAYVPLDPVYPTDRLDYMARDADLKVVLAQASVLERIEGVDAPKICIDEQWTQIQAASDERPPIVAHPRSLAYSIYTSGSTGHPKGTLVEHRGLANFARALARIEGYYLGETARVLQFSSFSFDASVLDMFSALCSGSTLVLTPAIDPGPELLDLLERERITTVLVPPSLLSVMEPRPLPHLKTLISGGEACSGDIVERWSQGRNFINAYGPTEATVAATTELCQSTGRVPPIGRPFSNVKVYLVDEHLQPVPAGVPGELLIGGKGVGRGYWKKPALSAEKFVPDELSGEPGARLYRTGDLTRYLPDGRIEFLGRIDHQVKVRGYRIETGEVAAALESHEKVQRAIVVVRGEGQHKQLVGYVTCEAGGEAVGAQQLREHVGAFLPAYMVPSALVVLDQMPLTPSGKIDRKALPAPDVSQNQAEYEPPSTPTEERLAQIWCELLGLEQVGRSDNFFSLGGHSLLATRLVSQVRAALNVELELRAVFEQPRLSALAHAVDEICAGEDTKELPPIEPVDRQQDLALSFAQERLWFLDQFDSAAAAAYHIPGVVRLEGVLDVATLEAAFNQVVERHEALRTRFASNEGTPFQLIGEGLALDVELEDLRELSDTEQAEVLEQKVQQEVERPFALDAGPLVRARLWKLSEKEHVLAVVMHHIVSDGWSIGIFVRELAELYQAEVEQRPSRLTELPVQYADYAAWQRQWLEGEVLDTQLAYWKDKLDGLEPLELSTDHPRPPTPTYRGASVAVELGEGLTRKLKDLARQREATLYQTLLAAFQLLLGRYSGQKTFAVGSPIAGRRHADLEGLIGLFLNTLVMRADLSQTPSFDQLLERTRQTTLDAYAHQDIPFEKLVAELEPERDTSRSPLFQVMFVLQNNEQPDIELEGLKLSGWGQRAHTAQFDLSLSLSEQQGRLIGAMTYSTDLFEEQTIEQMVCHFERLLDEVLEAPHRPVEHLEYLSQADHQQLARWNDTGVDYGVEQCLHELIEAQVARTPRAKALVFEGESVSYAELDRRANQLAHRLQAEGVGPESIVGLMAERSFEMVVGLLGILKAGAAYVPLDPEYPTARLAYMLEHAGVKVVVSQEALVGRVPEAKVAKVVCLEDDRLQDQPPGRVQVDRQPHHSAYVLFTSGSTGKPKGVLIEHRAIVNRLLWMQHAYRLEASDRVLQKTTYTFDVSVWEFFWPLMFGAALVVARPDGHKDPGYLADVIASERVTTMHFVPSMLRPFLQEPALEQKCTSLRRVICSGEALPPDSVKTFYERVAHAELHNLYGPTEAAIDVTAWPCPDTEQLARVYIGRPVANTQIHIVDAHFNPCAPGVPGELCIGGVQLARGYVNRPDLSARQFVVDPFDDQRGARMYRTGDKARWTSQGQVEYLGRLDFQVKLRGLRIELGEIEAVLVEHPHVRHAAVGVWHSAAGHEMLVAWVVGAQGLEIQQLREHAGGALPEYMVPAQFVQLDQMPLTSSGKTDRKKLPEPDISRNTAGYEAPVTATETAMVEVWGELLGIEKIGRHDRFFELGGHSLLATRLVSQIRKKLDVELELKKVFEKPRLFELAHAVDEARGSGATETLPPIEPVDRQQELALSFAQERLWFLDQFDSAAAAAYHIPGVVRLEGVLDVATLEAAFNQVVERHEALRTRFASNEGTPFQLIGEGLALDVELEDLRELSDTEQAEVLEQKVQQEVERPFALDAGPLVRARLWKLSEKEHVLAVVMHHIVSDGWSIGIFVRELAELYQAEVEQRPSRLTELPVQYADYAAWQRNWLEGEVLDTQLAYWKDKLDGLEPLELSTDHPRPPTPTYRGGKVDFELSEELTEGLKRLGRAKEATLYQTLLAAFEVLLSRYSGQKDVAVGSPLAGRRHAEVEGLIGLFVNTLVMRGELSDNPSFGALLERVKQTALDAYEYQDIPFEKLVAELVPVRDTSRHPLFQVMFVFQNHESTAVDFGGLEFRDEPMEHNTAKFDLTLNMQERHGRLSGSLKYASELFERETIEQMAGRFERLLEQVVDAPEKQVEDLELLDAQERHRLLHDYNDTTHQDEEFDSLLSEFAELADSEVEALMSEMDSESK